MPKAGVARQKSNGRDGIQHWSSAFVQHYLIATTRALCGRIGLRETALIGSLSSNFNSIAATYLLDSAPSESENLWIVIW